MMPFNPCEHMIIDEEFSGGLRYPQVVTCSIKNIQWVGVCDWEYCPWCGVKLRENQLLKEKIK